MNLPRCCAYPIAMLGLGLIAIAAMAHSRSAGERQPGFELAPPRVGAWLPSWLNDLFQGRSHSSSLQLDVPDATSDLVIPLAVSTNLPARVFRIDVDLNHDGRFEGRGELDFAEGRFDSAGVGRARLHGLVEGRYAVRARVNVGGRETLSELRNVAVLPAPSRQLPVCFEPNQGQADRDVLFLARTHNQMVLIQAAETALVTMRDDAQSITRFRLVGGNRAAVPLGRKTLPGTSNYFIGNQAGNWRTDVPHYQEVVTPSVYPGIDLVHHSAQGRLEYDFRVAPGADPGVIALEFPDARDVELDADGSLVLRRADGGTLHKSAPIMYQKRGNHLEAVKGDWRLIGANRVGYVIAAYDPARELVIDPIIFSTYRGGTLDDTAQAAVVDAAGNTYVTGFTLSANFPVQGPFQAALSGTQDLFVCKINPAGTAVVYATYLGGTGADGWINGKQGIAVDSAGNAIVTAGTPSADYPMLNAAQAVFGGLPWDCVVTKLNPAGNALVFSTYLGGNSWDLGYGLAVDGTDNIYVTGLTSSPNFPTTAGAFQTVPGGGNDAFVTKYTPAGVVVYSTYLGGAGGNEWGRAVTVRGTNAYVVGVTDSVNFPTTPGVLQTANGGGWDIFVTQLNATGTAQVYSTYLGGTLTEDSWGVAVDAAGNAFIACRTDSANFPTTPGAAQTTFGGGTTDGAIVKLNPAGAALVYATYLGGSAVDELRAIAIDASGTAYVTGFTLSANFPAVNPLQPSFGGGGGDAFVTVLNPAGSAFVMSTWLGGSGPEGGVGIGVDAAGNIYVAGSTNSANFPTLNPIQATNAGAADLFITKISLTGPPPPPSAQILYGITVNDQLLTIDTSTGAGTLVGTVSPPMSSMGIAFRGNKLYAADNLANRIQELNPANAALLNTINVGIAAGGGGDITFRNDGIGFLTDTTAGGRLFNFDITVPNNNLITGSLNPNMVGLAFDPAGILLGLQQGGTGLHTINATTGATTLIGGTGIPALQFGGLAVDTAGNVYASVGPNVGNSNLYAVNRVSGTATVIGSIGFNGVSGLAFLGTGGGGGGGGGGPGGGVDEGSYPGSSGPSTGGGSGEGSFGFGGGGFSFGGGIPPERMPILHGPLAAGMDFRVVNVSHRHATQTNADAGFGPVGWSLVSGLALALLAIAASKYRSM